jgi:hypothetical protein
LCTEGTSAGFTWRGITDAGSPGTLTLDIRDVDRREGVMMNAVDKAMTEFPETFGLRAFPGQRFTLNRSASYERPLGSGDVMLYVFTEDGLAFSKGSPAELRGEVTPA